VIDLEVTGIHKSYGSQPVLQGLDLAVVAGSFT
jgi:ABC-type histidine transport system ATPase subunit